MSELSAAKVHALKTVSDFTKVTGGFRGLVNNAAVLCSIRDNSAALFLWKRGKNRNLKTRSEADSSHKVSGDREWETIKKLNMRWSCASERESRSVSPKCSLFDSLLFLFAEQAEAFLLVLLFVLLSLARTRLGGECDGGRQRLSAPGRWRARVAALDVGAVGGAGVQDGLDPGAHLLLQRATQVRDSHLLSRYYYWLSEVSE